jgi:hypothetical protein
MRGRSVSHDVTVAAIGLSGRNGPAPHAGGTSTPTWGRPRSALNV